MACVAHAGDASNVADAGWHALHHAGDGSGVASRVRVPRMLTMCIVGAASFLGQ